MQLNDFSSVLELFCGYNLANAFNDDYEISKLLSVSTTKKVMIDELFTKIKALVRKVTMDIKSSPELLEDAALTLGRLSQLNERLIELKKANHINENRIKSQYLIAGCLAFFLLVFAGFTGDYHKANSISLTLVSVVVLGWVLIQSESPKTNNPLKYFFVGLSVLLVAVPFALRYFQNELYHRHDQLWLIWSIISSFAFLLVVFRKQITGRKLWKTIFIVAFIVVPFLPFNRLGYEVYYPSSHSSFHVGCQIVLIILIMTFPIAYDVLFYQYLLRKLNWIDHEVKAIDELTQGGIDTNDATLNPFKNV